MTEAPVRTLVEREAELASLDALIAGAVEGSGRLVLIEGPAGVGKSRLLTESRERAADSMTVPLRPGPLSDKAFPAESWERLKRVKADVDPDGLFLANHEIR